MMALWKHSKRSTNAHIQGTQTKGYLMHQFKMHNKTYCHGRTVILQESNKITHKNKKKMTYDPSHITAFLILSFMVKW